MRLLHAGYVDHSAGISAEQSGADRGRRQRRDLRQSLPLHRLPGDHRRHLGRRQPSAQPQGAFDVSQRLFGQNVRRLEDPDLLTGRARFIDDIHLPGMLEAAFVRSPHAHAAINGIDKRAALAVPGVYAVYTLADLLPHLTSERLVVGLPSKSYKQNRDRPALAHDEVVHVGEPVAIVVAEDRYIAEDALALVEVDYNPLPAASDCRDALAAEAPRVHRNAPHNMLAEFAMAYGDVEGAFASAPHVFRESYKQHRGGSHSIECRGAVAIHDAFEDRLTLWSSTQMPHAAQRLLCDLLGREENRVRVVAPDLGGGFG